MAPADTQHGEECLPSLAGVGGHLFKWFPLTLLSRGGGKLPLPHGGENPSFVLDLL